MQSRSIESTVNKIVPFETLNERVQFYQQNGKRVVLCYGVFNVLHVGHIRYLKQAAKYGDILVVVLAVDASIGNLDYADYDDLRAEALAYLDFVDMVSVNTCSNYRDMIQVLKPDVYAKGFESVHADSSEAFDLPEKKFFQDLDIQFVMVREEGFTSSQQINRYLSGYSEEVFNYIHMFKKRYDIEDLLTPLEKLKELKVLIIGDTILDEYQYCSAIGKSSKDPALALKYENTDIFAGGILAIGNHVAGFAGQVDLVTIIGAKDSYEGFIRSRLATNINPRLTVKPDAPTLIKRRFIDGYSMSKLFEVYVMDDSPLDKALDLKMCNQVLGSISDYDLILIGDYGHGTISPEMIRVLTENSAFLAVNTQANAGNRGFNTISKYPRSDYVSLAEHEIRLETRDMTGRLFPMMDRLARRMNCKQFVVTRGKKGCMLYDIKEGLIQVPSFAMTLVDRVGAGDAFFAVTALMSATGLPGEILGFMGNAAGSLAVEMMGNQKSVNKQLMERFIRNILSSF